MNHYVIKPAGDQAAELLLEQKIETAVNEEVMALRDLLSGSGRASSGIQPGLIREVVPAYASLLVYYDPEQTDFAGIKNLLERLLARTEKSGARAGRRVEIPVCYGGVYGEDLPYVARHAGLTEEEVIRLHSGREYRIYMLGFLPGFPYLGGMDERLVTPRLASPRTKIPAGSVGIGGAQTGIYPMESPGGWQLIGRTPLLLFDPKNPRNLPYEAGDRICFVPVDEAEYQRIWKKETESNGN